MEISIDIKEVYIGVQTFCESQKKPYGSKTAKVYWSCQTHAYRAPEDTE